MKLRFTPLLFLFLLSHLMTGCRNESSPTPTVLASSTSLPATETQLPTAAVVNGEPIFLSDFEDEVARYQDARGTDLATQELNQTVLKALIDRKLLAQSAKMQGYSFDEALIDQNVDQLTIDVGGESAFQTWLQVNHYSMHSFRNALEEESLASAMVELISEGVPKTDVHARALHILVATEDEALALREQILAGADFSELAVMYSLDLSTKPAGGDLGWFARGTLTIPEVEERVFSLQPGETSEVISSTLGYHLVQLIGLEERPLSPQLLAIRRERAVVDWLSEQWESAEIISDLLP